MLGTHNCVYSNMPQHGMMMDYELSGHGDAVRRLNGRGLG